MLKTETAQLNLMIEGQNSDQVVLLLHGGPGFPDYLAPVAGMLGENFKTVRFDQRGAGKSLCLDNQFDVEAYMADIDAVFNHLQVDRIHLFGHSWGGLQARIWAARNPDKVRSLFLCSPSPGTGDRWKKMEQEIFAYNQTKATGRQLLRIGFHYLLGVMGSDRAVRRLYRQLWRFYFHDPAKIQELNEEFLSGIHAATINKSRAGILAYDKDNESGLAGLQVPILVSYGEFDIFGSSTERVRSSLPQAQYYQFENTAHLPWLEDTVAFQRLVDGFFLGYFTKSINSKGWSG